MSDLAIPAPIDAFIGSVNSGDETGFLAAFAESAFVDDWGRIFSGHAAIKDWSSVEFIGSDGVLTPQSVDADGTTVIVVGDWRSNHANGPSQFTFTVEAGKVSSMTIREG